MKRIFVLCTILVAGMTVAAARDLQPTAKDALQAACYPDIQRLCADAIPDEAQVRTCMEGKRAQVSAKCRDAYKKAQE